jgi:hypothetical protein
MQRNRGVIMEAVEQRVLFANAHFIDGPTYTVQGTTLNATGSIAGLGNQDVTLTLTATGTASITAYNPGGKANKHFSSDVNVSATQTYTDVKNGKLDFSLTTPEQTADANLPNSKWTATITVQFSSATITCEQGGEVVLTDTTTF